MHSFTKMYIRYETCHHLFYHCQPIIKKREEDPEGLKYRSSEGLLLPVLSCLKSRVVVKDRHPHIRETEKGDMGTFVRFLFRSPIRVPVFATSPLLSVFRNPDASPTCYQLTKKILIDKMKSTQPISRSNFVFYPKKFNRSITSSRIGPIKTSAFCRRKTSILSNLVSFAPRGSNLRAKSFTGLSILAGTLSMCPTHACSKDGSSMLEESQHSEPTNPSDFLKEDLYNFWLVAERFQMPAVLLFMVLYGWRNPITLVINIVLLLSCTRPRPYSVYIFIEKLRERAMRQNPGISKSKLSYARKVDVQDYKLLCTARVELKGWELNLVGILGSWWILQSTRI